MVKRLASSLRLPTWAPRGLAATGGALGVAGLHLVGAVGPWWWLLALSTAAGVLLLPSTTAESRVELQPPPSRTLRQTLSWLAGPGLRAIPVRSQEVLVPTLSIAADLADRFDALGAAGELQIENQFAFKEVVCRFLPKAIEAYMQLPEAFAQSVAVRPGETAADVLHVQLKVLHTRMVSLQQAVITPNVTTLLAQQQFLAEKFPSNQPPEQP